MRSVYKFLGHHYILRRSVVFIVDTDFDLEAHRATTASYVCTFFDKLSSEDHFGYISLDEGDYRNRIKLEKKA